MAMDLENIMQDTIVIQARAREKQGDRGRSKKWKEILKLPPAGQCLYLREEVEHSYEGLIENQPIGLSLFEEFCMHDLTLSRCHQFLKAVEEFHLVAEEKGAVTAGNIYDNFLSPQNPERLEPVHVDLVGGIRDKIMLLPVPKNVFDKCRHVVREYLSGQAFIDYVDSQYYWRYLQWKHLERAPVTKNSFRVYRVLGKGGFGLVHACQSKATGKMYALKKLEKKRVKKRKGDKLALNEKVILEKVDSKFVVNLAYAYQTKEALCMVLTLMNGGDLRFHIHNIGAPGLDIERTVFYAAEIAMGLSHLHARRIAYRDMKPDNILLDDQGHVRISDLGLAVHIPEGQSVRGRVGTVGYMAPEVIDNHRYTFSPDWWGLGCVVYEMIHGECPFRKRKERVSREKVEKRVREDTVEYSDKFCRESRSLCSLLLQKVHSNRLGTSGRGFEDLKAHGFFKSINWKHLEMRILDPPFTPNPRAVYAKDVLDIDAFSSIRGVDLLEADEAFAAKFSTGACSKPWQEEMIESKVFADINKLNPIESMTLDSNSALAPPQHKSKGSWLKRLFRFKKQVSTPPPTTEGATARPALSKRSHTDHGLLTPSPETNCASNLTTTSNPPSATPPPQDTSDPASASSSLPRTTSQTPEPHPHTKKENVSKLSTSTPNLHETGEPLHDHRDHKFVTPSYPGCRYSVGHPLAVHVGMEDDLVEEPQADVDMHVTVDDGNHLVGATGGGVVSVKVLEEPPTSSSEEEEEAEEEGEGEGEGEIVEPL